MTPRTPHDMEPTRAPAWSPATETREDVKALLQRRSSLTMSEVGVLRHKLFPDVYGHESKIALGMEGKAHLIPKEKTPVRAEAIGSLAESTGTGGYAKKDLVHRVFGNN